MVTQPQDTSRLTVLVVDDHPDTVSLLSRLLGRRGYFVVAASDVRTAVEAAELFRVDVLVSDLTLPDGSGRELCRSLRRAQPHVKAIALSGHADESDVRASLAAGFCRHLPKPTDLPELVRTIDDCVRAS